jgi:hypothetical protein
MQGLQAARDQFGRNIQYLYSNYDELLDRYPEQHVAVYNGAVVDAGDDLKALVGRLKERGIPPEWTFIRYMTREPITLILYL